MFDDFFRDPADEQEYEDMALGLNTAGLAAFSVLLVSVIIVGGLL